MPASCCLSNEEPAVVEEPLSKEKALVADSIVECMQSVIVDKHKSSPENELALAKSRVEWESMQSNVDSMKVRDYLNGAIPNVPAPQGA